MIRLAGNLSLGSLLDADGAEEAFLDEEWATGMLYVETQLETAFGPSVLRHFAHSLVQLVHHDAYNAGEDGHYYRFVDGDWQIAVVAVGHATTDDLVARWWLLAISAWDDFRRLLNFSSSIPKSFRCADAHSTRLLTRFRRPPSR